MGLTYQLLHPLIQQELSKVGSELFKGEAAAAVVRLLQPLQAAEEMPVGLTAHVHVPQGEVQPEKPADTKGRSQPGVSQRHRSNSRCVEHQPKAERELSAATAVMKDWMEYLFMGGGTTGTPRNLNPPDRIKSEERGFS